jgi:hypothetical protein
MSAASLPELLPAIEHDDDCESEHEFRIVRAEALYSEPFPSISGAALAAHVGRVTVGLAVHDAARLELANGGESTQPSASS